MAGRGMGIATRGGGAVGTGPKNKVLSMTEETTGPVMMAKGGDVSPRKKMAMGMAGGGMMKKGMAAGGMMTKGYAAGGAAMKKKGYARGGKKG